MSRQTQGLRSEGNLKTCNGRAFVTFTAVDGIGSTAGGNRVVETQSRLPILSEAKPRVRVGMIKTLAMRVLAMSPSSQARRILLGWRVEEDARIDPEVAGQDADVPGIEPAPAQEDLRQR